MVQKARASSAPGPSGVPYKVDKNYPRLLLRLLRILKVIWSRGKVAHQWRYTDGVWIPKEEDSKNNEQFRTISLLSVEGKCGSGAWSASAAGGREWGWGSGIGARESV